MESVLEPIFYMSYAEQDTINTYQILQNEASEFLLVHRTLEDVERDYTIR